MKSIKRAVFSPLKKPGFRAGFILITILSVINISGCSDAPDNSPAVPDAAPPVTQTPSNTDPFSNTYLPEVPRISVTALKARLDEGRDLLVVDSRSEYSYEQSHIAGAISIPFTETGEHFEQLKDYDEVIFYCS